MQSPIKALQLDHTKLNSEPRETFDSSSQISCYYKEIHNLEMIWRNHVWKEIERDLRKSVGALREKRETCKSLKILQNSRPHGTAKMVQPTLKREKKITLQRKRSHRERERVLHIDAVSSAAL